MTYELTKVDVAALRKADSVSFTRDANGSRITMVKKAPEPTEANPFPQDVYAAITCDSRLRDYEGSMWGRQHDHYRAAHHETSAQLAEEWQTVAATLKAGDELTLEWLCGNSSEAMRTAGVTVDELRLRVDRDGKGLVFLIERQVILNQRWRMIQRDESALAAAAA